MRYLWLLYLYKCRNIDQNGNSFEGKEGSIMNNDGTVSSDYKQGVFNNLKGELIEGNRINNLWNGKVNFKWKDGDREISEWLNNKEHGPIIVYDFDGKVNKEYYSNGEEIFLS